MLLVIYSAFTHFIDFGNMNKYEKEILSQRWFPWRPVSYLRYSMGSPETTKDAFLIQRIPRDAVPLGEVLLAPQKLQRSWELDTRNQRSKVKGRTKAFPAPRLQGVLCSRNQDWGAEYVFSIITYYLSQDPITQHTWHTVYDVPFSMCPLEGSCVVRDLGTWWLLHNF